MRENDQINCIAQTKESKHFEIKDLTFYFSLKRLHWWDELGAPGNWGQINKKKYQRFLLYILHMFNLDKTKVIQ